MGDLIARPALADEQPLEFTLGSQHFLEVDARVRHFDVGALLTTDCWHREADTGRMASLDVMELNPALDVRNQTARVAVDLIESLFGKSTLMRAGT